MNIMLKTLPNDALLTLAIPAALEEDIVDFLLARPEWASGFTMLAAQGIGSGADQLTAMEQVQGRSARKLVLVAAPEARLHELLQALADELPSNRVSWWIAPLVACGRLA